MSKFCEIIITACVVIFTVNSCVAAPPPPKKKVDPSQAPTPQPAYFSADGDEITVFVDTANPQRNRAFACINGLWTVFKGESVQLFITNGPSPTPGPGPTPTPTPTPVPLNARQTRFFNAARQATADAARVQTARYLAANYLAVAAKTYPNTYAMMADAHANADLVIPATAADAWKPFRAALNKDWDDQARIPPTNPSNPNADFSLLLQDAATALNASALTP